MKTLAKIFFQGLLVFVPVVGTVALVSWLLITVDSLVPLDVPFAGIGLVVVSIFALGLLANNMVGRKILEWLERGMKSVPFVKIVYSSIKDLLGAFVGDTRSFDKPAMVRVSDDVRVFGFVTCDHFDDVRLAGHVAVYLPQSYNFAGNLMIVPEDRVEPVDADSAQFMAFIVSGGVAQMSAARTAFDGRVSLLHKER
ncbi:MAG: DUF502 domain-containing protein [Sandaracinaceae bacterium]|nr:DUF502 domain-containing protein [Sandaracinaceae bacterium]